MGSSSSTMSSESQTHTKLPVVVMQKQEVESAETTNRVEEKEKEVESTGTTNRVEEKEEGEEECWTCLYMKGGSCKEIFTTYDKCLDDNKGEENSKCAELAQALVNCMSENIDYYGPIMEVMKAFYVSKESEVEKEVGDVAIEKPPVEEEKNEETPVEEKKEKPAVEETTKEGNPKPRKMLGVKRDIGAVQ